MSPPICQETQEGLQSRAATWFLTVVTPPPWRTVTPAEAVANSSVLAAAVEPAVGSVGVAVTGCKTDNTSSEKICPTWKKRTTGTEPGGRLTFLAAAPEPAAGAGAAVGVRQAEAKPLAVQLGAARLLAVSAKHSHSAGCNARRGGGSLCKYLLDAQRSLALPCFVFGKAEPRAQCVPGSRFLNRINQTGDDAAREGAATG